MIYTYKINADIQIKSLEDLVKLKPFQNIVTRYHKQ